jgi:hypothetical protein
MNDDLREKLDALALGILGKISVGEAIERSVIDAMTALTTVSKWYAIKNKVSTGEEEGNGINDYQKRLSGQTGAGGSGGEATPEPGTNGAPGHAGEPEPSNGTGRAYKQDRKGGDFASGRGDRDNGGEELNRFVASLPSNAGSDAVHQHGPRHKARAVRGNSDSGASGVEDAGESDLDDLVG